MTLQPSRMHNVHKTSLESLALYNPQWYNLPFYQDLVLKSSETLKSLTLSIEDPKFPVSELLKCVVRDQLTSLDLTHSKVLDDGGAHLLRDVAPMLSLQHLALRSVHQDEAYDCLNL
jgi:hypothetical protein